MSLSKRDNLRRSRRQEKRVAEDVGGSCQAGSGSRWEMKGDVRKLDAVRVECKTTRGKGFRVTREVLEKIEREASGLETPVLQLDFENGDGTVSSYGIVRWDDLLTLLKEAGIREDE